MEENSRVGSLQVVLVTSSLIGEVAAHPHTRTGDVLSVIITLRRRGGMLAESRVVSC